MKYEKVSSVFKTFDYDDFVRLVGNRSIGEKRIRTVMESINAVGQMKSPILINDKKEVIDGQARLEAFRRLHLPVYFVVAEGIGIKECISMNIKQSNWSMMDYIDCYAEIGNQSYKYVKMLLERHKGKLPLTVILWVASKGQNRYEGFKAGNYVMMSEEFQEAESILQYLALFTDVLTTALGRVELYYHAIAFCYSHKDVDRKRLINVIHSRSFDLTPIANELQAIEIIDKIYNYKARENSRILLANDWRAEKEAALHKTKNRSEK